MKRTFKYKEHISKWYNVDLGDVLILKGKDGTIFDTVITMKSDTKEGKCANCPLSGVAGPGECMHYAFACNSNMTTSSLYKALEDL